MKFLSVFTICLAIPFFSLSQNHRCGFDETLKHLDDDEVKAQEEFESYYQNWLSTDKQNKKETKYIIPVVFHVIHENGTENVSDEDIIGLVKQVNEDFNLMNADTASIGFPFKKDAASMNIEFRLARKTPDGSCTNGITRTLSTSTREAHDNVKQLEKWDNTRYLNIWTVRSIRTSGEGTTLGYAYFPGTSRQNDGIVMRADQMNSNTLTHEIGHYLNLYHTFQNGCSGESNSNCSRAGDRVCDTPPTADQNFGCPKSLNSCQGEFPDVRDQVENYMDYSNCSAMFTAGQRERMHAAIELFRSQLVSKANLEFTGVSDSELAVAPEAAFSSNQRITCPGEEVTFYNNSCHHMTETEFNWTFEGPVTLTSTDPSPRIVFNEQGLYTVSLETKNSNGTSTKKTADFLRVTESEGTTEIPFIEQIDQQDLPENWVFEYDFEDFKWEMTENGYDGSSCIFIESYYSPTSQLSSSFILPPVNIMDATDQYLRFHLAHTGIDNSSADILSISGSVDCGKTWLLLRTNTTRTMSSVGNTGTPFVPTAQNQWQLNEVDISRYAPYPNLLIKFELSSGGGNNLYIDNITVGTAALSTGSLNINRPKLFPNPVDQNSSFTISWEAGQNATLVELVDMTGRLVRTIPITNTHQININTNGIESGLYEARLLIDGQYSNHRIIIQ